MFPSFRLGTLFGFPIRTNLSFLLLLGAVFLWMGGTLGVAIALMTAASVVVHELGHALTARRLGIAVSGIEMHIFGGVAQIAPAQSPRDEILVSAAGPAVSLALAAVGFGLGVLTGVQVFALFGSVNLVLGLFNLLPAFPSDGGRILRALLARRYGLVRATDLAVSVGRFVCAGLVALALVEGSLQLALVAGVLWLMGGAERRNAHLRGDHGDWRRAEDRRFAESEYLPPPRPRDRIPGAPPRVTVRVWRI